MNKKTIFKDSGNDYMEITFVGTGLDIKTADMLYKGFTYTKSDIGYFVPKLNRIFSTKLKMKQYINQFIRSENYKALYG